MCEINHTHNLQITQVTVAAVSCACKAVSDLLVALLQMVGRAGRPQFDTEGVAVIMTQQQVCTQEVQDARCVKELTLHE